MRATNPIETVYGEVECGETLLSLFSTNFKMQTMEGAIIVQLRGQQENVGVCVVSEGLVMSTDKNVDDVM